MLARLRLLFDQCSRHGSDPGLSLSFWRCSTSTVDKKSMAMAVTTLCTLWVVAAVVLLFNLPSLLCMEVVNASTCTRGLSSSSLASADSVRILIKGSRPGEYLQLFIEQTEWYNDLILGLLLPESVRDAIPRNLQTWLRFYKWKGDVFFPTGGIPGKEAMLRQMGVAMKAMPAYSGVPALSEYVIEKGWTKNFARIDDVGWPTYICLAITYFLMVEFGVYWIHRLLHEFKPLYKWIHATHHIDNKHTLSPFSGLAFSPVDGFLESCPHVIVLFILPMHFLTHMVMLFSEIFWTTTLHDRIDGNVWGALGAAHHLVHHTTYKHNYGHSIALYDWLFGTLHDPYERKKVTTHAKAS